MNFLRTPFKTEPEPLSRQEVIVPDGRWALVILDGFPERVYPPGCYQLTGGEHKIEVRLLLLKALPGSTSSFAAATHDGALPFDRGFCYLDGELVAILKQPREAAVDLEHDEIGEMAAPRPGKNPVLIAVGDATRKTAEANSFVVAEALLPGLIASFLRATRRLEAAWRSR